MKNLLNVKIPKDTKVYKYGNFKNKWGPILFKSKQEDATSLLSDTYLFVSGSVSFTLLYRKKGSKVFYLHGLTVFFILK